MKAAQKYSGNTKPSRIRSWVYTSFLTEAPEWDPKVMNWLIYAPETCPKSKKHHWQCFVYLKNGKTFNSAQKYLKGHHIEEMKEGATFLDQWKYIVGPWNRDGKMKPFNPLFKEFGKCPKQGCRTDLLKHRDALINGETTVDEICIDYPHVYHIYGRTLNRIEDIILRKKWRTKMTKGIWYWGPTGSGKSHKQFKNFNNKTHYVYKNDGGWWDGYTGQETVIINDFRGGIKYNEMLQIVDKWPYSVRRRNREPMPFLAKLVIISSDKRPKKVYARRTRELTQLMRRFKIIKVDK